LETLRAGIAGKSAEALGTLLAGLALGTGGACQALKPGQSLRSRFTLEAGFTLNSLRADLTLRPLGTRHGMAEHHLPLLADHQRLAHIDIWGIRVPAEGETPDGGTLLGDQVTVNDQITILTDAAGGQNHLVINERIGAF
jgi:hypothetical protein